MATKTEKLIIESYAHQTICALAGAVAIRTGILSFGALFDGTSDGVVWIVLLLASCFVHAFCCRAFLNFFHSRDHLRAQQRKGFPRL